MFEFVLYPTNYHSATFHYVGVKNTGLNLISMIYYHVMTWQYVHDIV